MAVHETGGTFAVRREIRKGGLSRAEADRLDALLVRAQATALRDFSLGLSGCPTIKEALDRFVADPTAFVGVSDGRKRYYRRVLLRFAADLSRGAGDIAVDAIAMEDIKEWLRKRLAERGHRGKYEERPEIGPATAANELKVLKRFAKWCADQRYCSRDIDVFRLPNLRVPRRNRRANRFPPRAVHERDLLSFLARLRQDAPRCEYVLRAMMLHGIRPEAVFLLERRSYVRPTHERAGGLWIPPLKGGTPTYRAIGYASGGHRFMEDVCAWADGVYRSNGMRASSRKPLFPNQLGRRWSTSSFDRALSVAVRRLRLGRTYTAYMARHSAITWLKLRGVSPCVIQHYAKHLSVATQEVYDWTTNEQAGEAYEIMEGILDHAAPALMRHPAEWAEPSMQEIEQAIIPLYL